MASADSDSEGLTPASHGPRECMACRGSGHVISNLGGTPSTITCPWCRGGGMRVADIDAQAQWLERGGDGDGVVSDAAPEPAA